ncbi:Peptidase M16 inactive domain protein [Streptomyces sp. ADI96-02]|uniref:M16 family metallopeptidase n=1 Tax=Streptomyces sp. ADI96-02 TaxID=1522760 RepID=UPI000F54F457|nr:insulinase family protein [Streptomyces sp. ADI96-02]RPK62766.1 Peptidase M16 inactive domain protein [Streptomyces sp. ADI96-02]
MTRTSRTARVSRTARTARTSGMTADAVLPGGLRVRAAHAPGAPLAELRLVIPYARTEPALAAAQELLAACLGTGARDRSGRNVSRQDIADRAADLGAEFSTVVTAESLILSVSVLAPGLPGVLGLLADLLERPRYDEGELALARRRAAAAPRLPAPRVRLRRAALAHGFGPHPLTAEAGGTAPLLDVVSLRAEDLHALHARAVVPGGSSLVVLADEEPDAVLRAVGERLSAWTGGPSGLTLPSFAHPEPRPGRVRLTDGSGRGAGPEDEAGHDGDGGGQALVLSVGPAVPTADARHAPFHLAQLALGGYASARLAQRVRDRHGLAYAVSAGLRETGAGSWLEIACAGAPGRADRLADEISGCLRELAAEGPSPREVERARAYATGFTRFALATRAEEASALAGFTAVGLEADWLEEYRARLADVTAAEVAEAAASHLDPDRMVTATYEPRPAAPAPSAGRPAAPAPSRRPEPVSVPGPGPAPAALRRHPSDDLRHQKGALR